MGSKLEVSWVRKVKMALYISLLRKRDKEEIEPGNNSVVHVQTETVFSARKVQLKTEVIID